MTRKALGRGLSALLHEVESTPPTAGLESVAIDRIDPNPFQPRRTFPEASLKELADSIRASGLVQPVLLRRAGERFQLVAGERRWRAARLAGIESVPAVIRDLSDREALELALTENLLREELNPLEVAHGFEALQSKYALTHEEIAARLGISRSAVTNTLRLLGLPEEVQSMIQQGKITAGHARPLLRVNSAKDQIWLAKKFHRNAYSVRAAEDLVSGLTEHPSPVSPPAEKLEDPNVRAAVLEMERALGTRVKIVGNAASGRIEIRYYSGEDLNRIYEYIMRR
ncbi:MAG: ParB/RepB/Spo0J family partition protein [Terriglobia bacterium]